MPSTHSGLAKIIRPVERPSWHLLSSPCCCCTHLGQIEWQQTLHAFDVSESIPVESVTKIRSMLSTDFMA